MMVLLIAMCAAVAFGCATTMTDRIVSDAKRGLAYSANYVPIEGGSTDALTALHDRLAKLEIDVQYVDPVALKGAFGIAYEDEGTLYIKIRSGLSVNGSIEVLAHEAAHLFQPPHLTRAQGDVFAEVVSAHVSDRLGVPRAAKTSALWLRQYKASLRTALDLRSEIDFVVDMLTPDAYRPDATARQ